MKGIPKHFFVLHQGNDAQGQAWLQFRDHKLDLLGSAKADSKAEVEKMVKPSKFKGKALQSVLEMTSGQLLMIRL